MTKKDMRGASKAERRAELERQKALRERWKKRAIWMIVIAVIVFFLNVATIGYSESDFEIFLGFSAVGVALLGLFILGGCSQKIELLEGEVNKEDVLEDGKKELAGTLADGDIYAGEIDGKPLFIQASDRACVIGPPGTGKTVFLINQLLRWATTGNPFVCLDIKPEISEIMKDRLQELGYKVFIFNPTSPQDCYNPVDDLGEGLEGISELSANLIPSPQGAEGEIFYNLAQEILTLFVEATEGKSLVSAYNYAAKAPDIGSLLNAIRNDTTIDEEIRRDASNINKITTSERMLASVYGTFLSNLKFLKNKNIAQSLSKSDFSIKDLKGKTAVFLQFEEAHQETLQHLTSSIVGHMLGRLIARENREEPILLALDEIGNAAAVAGLTKKLNTIRSRNMPTWLYWQSTEQMQKYGNKADEGLNVILGACDFQAVFRLNDNATAEYFSKKIGIHEVEYVSQSEGYTSGEHGGSTSSTSRSIQKELAVEPHELMQLENFQMVATYRGKQARIYAKPYFEESI